jgi:hypothetical protein
LVDANEGRGNKPDNKERTPPALAVNSNMDETDAGRQTEQQQETTAERLRDKRDKRMVYFTGVIAFATVVYAGISAWQLITINSQLIEQKREAGDSGKQLDRELRKLNAFAYEAGVQARAESKAAAATKSAAETANAALANANAQFSKQMAANNSQLTAMKHGVDQENRFASASERSSAYAARSLADHEAEQRANVTLIGIANQNSGVATIGVQSQNIGPTVAVQVKVTYYFEGYPKGATRQELIWRQDYVFAQVLRTQGPLPESVAYLAPNGTAAPKSTVRISDAIWNLWKHYLGGWVLAARVTYFDIYGVPHWTNFCTYEVGNDSATYCPSHNDQDHNTRTHRATMRSTE